jgi:ubiquinone/menaquinone biosynthesis C-methylase UbiE
MYYWNEYIADLNACIKKGDHVFDAGAGDGHWRKRIPKDIQYTSMDLGVGDSNVDYSHLDIKGDLSKIPLETASVDVIMCIQVLEHVPQPWLVLKEFSRILKPGGYAFISLPHSVPLHQEPYDFYRYTKHGVRYLLTENDFDVEFIIPQLGNASKIANDMRMTGIELKQKGSVWGYAYKLLAKVIDIFFKHLDEKFDLYGDTTGYFIKARRK